MDVDINVSRLDRDEQDLYYQAENNFENARKHNLAALEWDRKISGMEQSTDSGSYNDRDKDELITAYKLLSSNFRHLAVLHRNMGDTCVNRLQYKLDQAVSVAGKDLVLTVGAKPDVEQR